MWKTQNRKDHRHAAWSNCCVSYHAFLLTRVAVQAASEVIRWDWPLQIHGSVEKFFLYFDRSSSIAIGKFVFQFEYSNGKDKLTTSIWRTEESMLRTILEKWIAWKVKVGCKIIGWLLCDERIWSLPANVLIHSSGRWSGQHPSSIICISRSQHSHWFLLKRYLTVSIPELFAIIDSGSTIYWNSRASAPRLHPHRTPHVHHQAMVQRPR